MVRQWPPRLGVGLHLFPFRVRLERGPIFPGFLTTRVLKDVDKEILRIRRVFRNPITNALHVVSLENSVGVIAKASFQSLHLALVYMIQAQFEDMLRGVRSAKVAETESHCGTADKR